jgi:hypothetical protein
MVIVKIKNNSISYSPIKDSFSRRVTQFENNILRELKSIGVDLNNIADFDGPKIPFAPKKAHIEWGLGSSNCCITVNKEKKYVDNLQLVNLCLKADVKRVHDGEISLRDFEEKYAESGDVHEKRKLAREQLGLDADCDDMEEINKAYKTLSKKHHPDMEGGCVESFKKINDAHKVLKRELE